MPEATTIHRLARRPKRSDLPVADVLRVVAARTRRNRAERERWGSDMAGWMNSIMTGPAEPDMCGEFPEFPPKVVIARLLQLSSNRGGHLIDYGVVVTRPWITPEGEALLASLSAQNSPGPPEARSGA